MLLRCTIMKKYFLWTVFCFVLYVNAFLVLQSAYLSLLNWNNDFVYNNDSFKAQKKFLPFYFLSHTQILSDWHLNQIRFKQLLFLFITNDMGKCSDMIFQYAQLNTDTPIWFLLFARLAHLFDLNCSILLNKMSKCLEVFKFLLHHRPSKDKY